MTEHPAASNSLQPLLAAMLDGQLADEQIVELRRLLAADPATRRQYVRQVATHCMLQWAIGGGQDSGFRFQGSGFRDQWTVEGVDTVGAAVQLPPQPGQEIPGPEPTVPPIILDLSPTIHYPLSTIHSFVGGLVFSYMVATVILGMMLLGAWAYKITHYQQIAEAPTVPSSERPGLVFVGRITGMADCRWADPSTEAYAGASVPLDRKYALASGLMEITYTTGAKVILQGPCTYEVESRRGGYLSLGKLTARIESAKPQAANQKSALRSPLSALRPPPSAFVVRTPTAIVTDLGTEFGVEVSEEGNTTSHVFRGLVRVQLVAPEKGTGPICRNGPKGASHQLDLSPFPAVVLRENESARMEKGDGKPSITRRAAGGDSGFVLEMPPPKSVRDSEAYAALVLSLKPVVYYRMERPAKKGTGPICAKHPSGRSGQLDLSPFSQVFDSAGGGHHGELRLGNEFGSPYVPGRFGDALWLRGPAVCDRVVVPDYPKTTDDRLTVSAWVLATGRPGWATIVSNWRGDPKLGNSDQGQFYFGLYRLDGDLCVYAMERDGQKWAQVREGASQPFPLFVWQHVALVADGTSLHLYRNGKLVASSPAAGIQPHPTLVGLGVGCKLNNEAGTDAKLDIPGYNFWQGRIDEVAVFNQALSAETIRQLYLGKPLPENRQGNNVAGTLRVPSAISGTQPAPDQLPRESNTRHPDGTRSVPATSKGGHPMNGP